MIDAILPWPAKSERKARLVDARKGAEESRRNAEKADSLVSELRELRKKNHVQEALDMIIQRGVDQRRAGEGQ